MKKFKVYILLAFALIMFKADDVFAGFREICKYEVSIKMTNAGANSCNAIHNTEATLRLGDEGYSIKLPNSCYYAECGNCSTTEIYELGNSIDNIIVNGNVILSSEAETALRSGKCPENLYIDLFGLREGSATQIQSCFANNEVDCPDKLGGYEQVFGTYEFSGKLNVSQSAKLTYGLGYTHTPKAEKKAEDFVKSKYVIDISNPTSNSYDENIYCSQVAGDVAALEQTIISDYDNVFWKYFEDLYATGDSITDVTKNNLKNYILGYKEGSTTIGNTIANNLRNDCDKLNQASDKSQEEKDEISQELDAGYTELVQGLGEFFSPGYDINTGIKPGDFTGPEGCEGFLGEPTTKGTPAYFLKLIMNIFKYLGIVLCLVFAVIDFLKAVTSQDQDLLKKAISTSVKRLVYAIIIFFLPIVINFILGLIGAYSTCL